MSDVEGDVSWGRATLLHESRLGLLATFSSVEVEDGPDLEGITSAGSFTTVIVLVSCDASGV
jgi:hypothetical protein